MIRIALTLIVIFLCTASSWTFSSTPASDLQPLFSITPPYLGADVSTSFNIPSLGTNFYLWLHGDTILGTFINGTRQWNGKMPRNSVGVLNVSSIAITSRSEAHYIREGAGNALHDGFWSPPNNPKQWYWPVSGVAVRGRAYVFAMRMEMGPPGLFPFQYAGYDVIALGTPTSADPLEWPLPTITTFPHINTTFSFGSAVTLSDGYVYLLGGGGATGNSAMMVRIDEESFELAAWENLTFYTKGEWTLFNHLNTPPDTLFEFVPSETTLVYHSLGFWYILIVNTFISQSVMIRTAPAPQGPWSDMIGIYALPTDILSGGAFCYAPKSHPELSALSNTTNEFVFTYMCNTPTIPDLLNRTNIYIPQVIRTTIGS